MIDDEGFSKSFLKRADIKRVEPRSGKKMTGARHRLKGFSDLENVAITLHNKFWKRFLKEQLIILKNSWYFRGNKKKKRPGTWFVFELRKANRTQL